MGWVVGVLTVATEPEAASRRCFFPSLREAVSSDIGGARSVAIVGFYPRPRCFFQSLPILVFNNRILDSTATPLSHDYLLLSTWKSLVIVIRCC